MSTGIRHFPEHIPKHADCQTVKVWPGHLAAEKVNSWSAALFIPILKHGYISNLEKMWRFQVCELAPSLSCLHTTNCQKLRHLDVQQPSDNSFDPSTSPLLSTCNTDEEGGRGGEKLEYIRWKRRCLFLALLPPRFELTSFWQAENLTQVHPSAVAAAAAVVR